MPDDSNNTTAYTAVRAGGPMVAVQELIAALEFIAKQDWHWAGGGSETRIAGQSGLVARRALKLPEQPHSGWPNEGDGY